MQRTSLRTITRFTIVWQHIVSTATRLALTLLCGLLLAGSALAQEQRPEQRPKPEQPTPEASPTQKAPDPNETLPSSPQANQVVDGDPFLPRPVRLLIREISVCRTTSAACASTGRTL